MADVKQNTGLRLIFSIFLGLMFTAFIGVGGYTFYPPPEQFNDQIRDLERREKEIWNSKPQEQLTKEDRDKIQEIVREQNKLIDAREAAWKPWARQTSILLIVFATLAMAVSLIRADQLPVISNGLLLGGVFTMLYGVGWIIATDTSFTRFWVVAAAFGITLGLGYVRFVRRGAVPAVATGSGIPEGAGLSEIERRVRDLEDRLENAAQAFIRKDRNSGDS
jgi:hypothetical protein